MERSTRDIDPKVATTRARVAGLARFREASDPEVVEARRALAAARLADRLRRDSDALARLAAKLG